MYSAQTSFIPLTVALVRFAQSHSVWGKYDFWYLGEAPFRYLIGPVVPTVILRLQALFGGFSLFDWSLVLIVVSWVVAALGWGILAWQLSGRKKVGLFVGLLVLVLPWHIVSSLALGEVSAVLASSFGPWVLLAFARIKNGELRIKRLIPAILAFTLLLLTNTIASIPTMLGLGILSFVLYKHPAEGFIAGNPAAVKLFGCRDEKDFISRSPADLSPKYQLDGALSTVKAQEMMAQAVKSGSNFFAWTHMRVSGENFPATMLLSRLEINGKPVLQATVRDLTESKKTEEAVKESQLMLQNIIDLLPTRIFWKDTNLNYLGGNKAFIQDAGKKSPEEILGKDDFEMGWNKLADRYRADDMAVITSGVSKLDYEEPLTTPAGDEIWVNTNKVPLRDNSGKIKGILGTYINITERKKAEKELQESEQKYKDLIEAVPLCIKLFDAQGNIVTVNKYGKKEHLLVGKNDEEIKKWKYMDCIEPAYRTLVAQKLKEAQTGKRAEFEFEHVPGTTTIGHWCYSYLEPIADSSGKVNYVLFISRDITAEKKNKEDVQKNIDQLTKLNEVMIGRELVMIKLKKELQVLRDSQNGEPVKN